jgi:hypothetical protein
MTMSRCLKTPPTGAGYHASRAGEITDIDLYAWIAQAEAGDALIYHSGFLVVDTDKALSMLPTEQQQALRGVAEAAFRAAGQGLVHLVQQRLEIDRFAYIAIARPKPKTATGSLSALLFAEQAA